MGFFHVQVQGPERGQEGRVGMASMPSISVKGSY